MTHFETHYFGTDENGRDGRQVYQTTTLTDRHAELRAQYADAYTVRFMDADRDPLNIQATVIHPSRTGSHHGKPDTVFIIGRRGL